MLIRQGLGYTWVIQKVMHKIGYISKFYSFALLFGTNVSISVPFRLSNGFFFDTIQTIFTCAVLNGREVIHNGCHQGVRLKQKAVIELFNCEGVNQIEITQRLKLCIKRMISINPM